jgi:hypothetical protein
MMNAGGFTVGAEALEARIRKISSCSITNESINQVTSRASGRIIVSCMLGERMKDRPVNNCLTQH